MDRQFCLDMAAAHAKSTTAQNKAHAAAYRAAADRLFPVTPPPVVVPPVPPAPVSSRPFVASSPWNTPIPAGTQWFDSAVLHDGADTGDTVQHYYFNELSMRVVHAKATDPLCTFNLAGFVDLAFNRNRPATTMTLPCPVGSMPGTDEDHIYHLRQPDGSYLELWQATRTGDTFAALGWATGSVVTGTGVGTLTAAGGNNAGVRAANTSWAAGLITGPEIDAGRIDHALAVMLGYGLLSNTAWRAPATAPDNGGHSGPIEMGTRLGIPPGTPRPAGLSPLGVAVFDALQTYGAFVVDFAGTPYPMFTVDAGTVAEGDPRVRRLFTWWDGWTADMDLIGPLVRVADYQPGG